MSEAISLGSPVTIVQQWATQHGGRCVAHADHVHLYFSANMWPYSVIAMLTDKNCLIVQFVIDLELATDDEETEVLDVPSEGLVHERSDEVAEVVDRGNDFNAARDFPGAFMYVEVAINTLLWKAPIVLVMPGLLTYGQLDYVLCQGVLAIEEFLVFLGRTQVTAENFGTAIPHGRA